MNTPITYTVNTKAETIFGIEACNTVLVSSSISACHGLFPCWVRTPQNKQNTTPHRIVSAFCIASICQFIRLICGKFFCWAEISHANNIMQWGLEIQKWNSLQTLKVKRWQLHSSLLLACKKLIRLLVHRLFPAHTASRVRGFKCNETIQSKALL